MEQVHIYYKSRIWLNIIERHFLISGVAEL